MAMCENYMLMTDRISWTILLFMNCKAATTGEDMW